MGREVRMVPKDWGHPKKEDGKYQPMHDELYDNALQEWLSEYNLWQEGKHPDQAPGEYYKEGMPYHEWAGSPPDPFYYRHKPIKDGDRTHYMMYETTTEGTPISPAFEIPEELAKWLADTGASSFGRSTATYDQWLSMIKVGWAPSAIMDNKGFRSGVEAASELIK